jgi:hypothetical protein
MLQTLDSDQIAIIRSMRNPYDYSKFIEECRAKNVMAMALIDYKESVNSLLSTNSRTPSFNTTPISVKRSCCGNTKVI